MFGPKEVVEPQQQAICDWQFVCGLERARNIQRVANRNQVVGFNVELSEGAFPNWEDPTKTRILKDKEFCTWKLVFEFNGEPVDPACGCVGMKPSVARPFLLVPGGARICEQFIVKGVQHF